jgi:hypothetical protein
MAVATGVRRGLRCGTIDGARPGAAGHPVSAIAEDSAQAASFFGPVMT